MTGFAVVVDVGRYGGFYFQRGYRTRLCLGWVAITYYPEEMDLILRRILKEAPRHFQNNNTFDEATTEPPEEPFWRKEAPRQ